MTSARIEVGYGRHGTKVHALRDKLVSAVNDARVLKKEIDQIAIGGDWEALAMALDMRIPEGENAGEPDTERAQAFYNLFGSAVAKLTETEVVYDSNGDPTTSTWLEQFYSRVS